MGTWSIFMLRDSNTEALTKGDPPRRGRWLSRHSMRGNDSSWVSTSSYPSFQSTQPSWAPVTCREDSSVLPVHAGVCTRTSYYFLIQHPQGEKLNLNFPKKKKWDFSAWGWTLEGSKHCDSLGGCLFFDGGGGFLVLSSSPQNPFYIKNSGPKLLNKKSLFS